MTLRVSKKRGAKINRVEGTFEFVDGVLDACAKVGVLEKQVAKLAKWIVNHPSELPDHACRECVGDGEIVIDGFRCGLHLAKSLTTPGAAQ